MLAVDTSPSLALGVLPHGFDLLGCGNLGCGLCSQFRHLLGAQGLFASSLANLLLHGLVAVNEHVHAGNERLIKRSRGAIDQAEVGLGARGNRSDPAGDGAVREVHNPSERSGCAPDTLKPEAPALGGPSQDEGLSGRVVEANADYDTVAQDLGFPRFERAERFLPLVLGLVTPHLHSLDAVVVVQVVVDAVHRKHRSGKHHSGTLHLLRGDEAELLEVGLLIEFQLQRLLGEVPADNLHHAQVQSFDSGEFANRCDCPSVGDGPVQVVSSDKLFVELHAALRSIGLPSIRNGVAVNPAIIAPVS